ncbi:unnamed protein product [Ophioblennius macclurei]
MDRNLLLLVLCLQVFLLVTASTVPQAAYLDAVGRQEQNHGQVNNQRRRRQYSPERRGFCGWRPGACGLMGVPPQRGAKIEPTRKTRLEGSGARWK